MRKRPILAIDGPMGAGKSTVAREVARRLGFQYLDTGAMYRAVAWMALQHGADLADDERLSAISRLLAQGHLQMVTSDDQLTVLVDGRDITREIRSPEVSASVAKVAKVPGVREAMTSLQRRLAREGGVVVEGRDMGTVVFPDAEVKIFLTATLEERARRRQKEMAERGEEIPLERVLQIIDEDDRVAMTRAVAPLRPAPDAVVIDTTGRTVEEVVEEIVGVFNSKVSLGRSEGRLPQT